MSDTFPRCPLHQTRIVGSLPEGCPLATENALDHVYQYGTRSYCAPGDDPHVAVLFAALHKTCGACVPALSSHPHVKYLRRKAGLNA